MGTAEVEPLEEDVLLLPLEDFPLRKMRSSFFLSVTAVTACMARSENKEEIAANFMVDFGKG